MSTPIRLTDKQARKLNLPVKPATPVQRSRITSPASAQTRQRNAQIKALLDRVAPLCAVRGWECDLYRCPTQDARNAGYESIRGYEAVNNAVVCWRVGSVRHLGFLWEIGQWSDEQIVEQLKG